MLPQVDHSNSRILFGILEDVMKKKEDAMVEKVGGWLALVPCLGWAPAGQALAGPRSGGVPPSWLLL